MWQCLLENLTEMKRFFGEELHAGATPEQIQAFTEKLKRDYEIELPSSYLRFLSYCDGFEFNGHYLLGTSDVVNDPLSMTWVNDAYLSTETWFEGDGEEDEFFLEYSDLYGEDRKMFWFYGIGNLRWYVRNKVVGPFLVVDADGHMYFHCSTVDELMLHLLRQSLGEPGPMLVTSLNIRDAQWKKGVLATASLMTSSLLMLGFGLYQTLFGTIEISPVALVILFIVFALFAFFTFILVNPNMHSSMQMVKGEMSYKELEETVARQRFEKPARFLKQADMPTTLLVSDEWLALGDKAGNPVYIPKSKVKSIEIRGEQAGSPDDATSNSQTGSAPLYSLRFNCKDNKTFDVGVLSRKELRRTWVALIRLFPDLEIRPAPPATAKS